MQLMILAALLAAPPEQPVIRSAADLPTARFEIGELPSKAFLSKAFVAITVPRLKSAAERLLLTHKFEDASIERQLRTGVAAIEILQGRPLIARQHALKQRAAETKPQLKAIGTLTTEAIAAGISAPPGKRCQAQTDLITKRLNEAEAAIIRDEVLARLSQAQTTSEAYNAGYFVTELDPLAAKTKSISLLDGLFLVRAAAITLHLPKCREEIVATYQAWLNKPENRPVDMWVAREPNAGAFASARPVNVAIWDSGIDLGLFPDQLAIDPAEPLDGKDNDGNGVIDDAHGPTWDNQVRPTPHWLAPPSAFLAPRLSLAMALDKGALDLTYGFDTPEAQMFAVRAREASVAEQSEDVDAAYENGSRSHGTFTASLVADGAPFIRLYNVRLLAGGHEPKLVINSEPETQLYVRAIRTAVSRMRNADVRVVNMSWMWTVETAIKHLLEGGLETDPEKARTRGVAMYERVRSALTEAITGNPQMLFVTVAGNSNQSDTALGALPQTLALPNLLVVGAAGQSGTPTSFTTFGPSVGIYARGEANRGRMPGGLIAHASGTSFAAPLVSRTAAQMIAVNSGLKPTEIIAGLKLTGTSGESGIRLVHSAAAVNWAKQQKRN